MRKKVKLGEGIEYERRTDGFTLRLTHVWPAMQPTVEINISDDLFDSLLLLQYRHRMQHDPSLTAGDLDRVADYGYGQGGEV